MSPVNDKTYSWYKVADSLEEIPFSAEGLAQIETAGKTICIANKQGAVAACTAKCPHAGGILANGYIDPLGNIVCPVHRYKFSLKNGRNTSGEGYYLKLFPVEIREEGVFVGFEQNNFFNWLK